MGLGHDGCLVCQAQERPSAEQRLERVVDLLQEIAHWQYVGIEGWDEPMRDRVQAVLWENGRR